MSFLYPELLFFTIPALLLTLLLKKRKLPIPFNPKIVIHKEGVSSSLLPFVLALIIVALARPVIERPIIRQKGAQPLFIAIDFSNSMRAEGRLEQAKSIALDLIQHTPFKTALLIFTTNPLIIAPPTSDKEALREVLASIDQRAILSKGTDFAKLLAFVGQFDGKKNLVIISDGGDFKDPEKLRSLASRHNIALFCVGVGSHNGALIPTDDGYLKSNGKLVVTRLNPAFSRLGHYYERDYLKILDDIDEELTKEQRSERIELFWVPLLVAFLLYLHAYTTLFERLRRFRYLPFVLAIASHASLLDEIYLQRGYELIEHKHYKEAAKILADLPYLEARYAYGVALYNLGKYSQACSVFGSLRSDQKEIKAKISYSLGLCYEKMGNYEKALGFYVKACQLQKNEHCLQKIAALALKKNPKKPLLPFSKQKIVPKSGKKGEQGKKGGGRSNINLALQSGAAKGGKRSKGASVSKKGAAHPVSSRIYELINKGYIDEKRPW